MFWQTYVFIPGWDWLWYVYKVLFAPVVLFDFNIWIPVINMPLKAFAALSFSALMLLGWWKLLFRR